MDAISNSSKEKSTVMTVLSTSPLESVTTDSCMTQNESGFLADFFAVTEKILFFGMGQNILTEDKDCNLYLDDYLRVLLKIR